ncbi:HNH endonuclease [Aureliella helgolandensis]|uniref:HNH endonuclease n=1 Tax=Aureliella helgolandensis TaxID=2527968 RepID=A0A518GB82_9BACT|nr:HNH endonuclease [Aureliella helgolandensis]
MPTPVIDTVRQHIAWAYANLARAHAALDAGAIKYARTHHMIRAKLFKGLTSRTMQMRTLYDDEKVKLNYPQACCYCGATTSLSIDHLIPRIKGGEDYSDNLVWACKSCNSSKRDRDLLEWCLIKNAFPSVLLLRRYMKLVARYCEAHELLDIRLEDAHSHRLPFMIELLPYTFPDLSSLVLWVPIQQPESPVSAGDR